MSKPKILVYDIESSPILGYTWGYYDQNLLSIVEDWYMLSFAWKWHGEPKISFERKAVGKGNDRELVKKLWGLMDEADVVLAHNGDQFDNKKTWARFLHYDLGPPSSYQSIDTLKAARRHFKLTSNKLDEIGRALGLGHKATHSGLATWFGCMNNDEKSWKVMEKYNRQDVALLEEVYNRIRPYIRTTVNFQNWSGAGTCPKCGSGNVRAHGFRYTAAAKKQEYKCYDCGSRTVALMADDGRLRQ